MTASTTSDPRAAEGRTRFHAVAFTGVDAMSAFTARSFPRHTHDQYGIGVMDSGGHASWSVPLPVQATPGCVILVNPGEVHDGRAVQGLHRSWRMLYLDPAVVDETLADIDGGEASTFAFAAPVLESVGVRRIFDAAFVHMTAASNDRMAGEAALLHLLAHGDVHAVGRTRPATTPAPAIWRAKQMIDDDPSAPLRLATLARETGTSRYQLLRGFASALGLTPHAYILQRRVALARGLIRAGCGLAEVASASGFYDQSHLNRCFVRQYGVTPRRYASPST